MLRIMIFFHDRQSTHGDPLHHRSSVRIDSSFFSTESSPLSDHSRDNLLNICDLLMTMMRRH